MKLLSTGRATLAALVAGGVLALFATPARASDLPGRVTVHDEAALFSSKAKSQAEDLMSAAKFDRGLHFHVDTYKAVPADRLSAYNAAGDKNDYVYRWAQDVATGDKAKGPYVLIVMSPRGHTQVVLDTETRNRGFDDSNRRHLAEIFDKAFKESANKPNDQRQSIRDRALIEATTYVVNDLKGTKVTVTKDGAPLATKSTEAKKTGMSIGGWICLGLVVLLAIWLVVGVIRALTSPAYGGGPGYGGGGYGGGGGGFGFGTALLGGMFGAMAGMYLYNSMMGTHYPPQAFGGEATAADASSGGGDTGAGDYSGGSATDTGGDYGGDGGGDYGGGGGDYGGGGGDYGGGGGDYGGGGGDYGGGGGDYGGGGDFGGGDYGGGGDF